MSGIVGSKLNIRGSGLVGSLGTDGQHLLSAGAGVTNVFETAGGGYSESSVIATTSGSYIDFTSIPATATIIHLVMDNVSMDQERHILIQIGDSGGVETSGYGCGWSRFSSTSLTGGVADDDGLEVRAAAAYAVSAVCSLYLCDVSDNAWIMHSASVALNLDSDDWQFDQRSVAFKELTGTLDRVRIETDGAADFDLGKAIIRYI